jgi:hypothetical protein
MADEKEPAPPEQAGSNISPAPADVAGPPPNENGTPAAPPPETIPTKPADPLPDGTVPTVLAPGTAHKKVPKGKASLTNIYRRADILTTLITFGGTAVAAVVILGGYAYFTRAKTPAPAPKITTLNQADLSKLNSFFNGNSAGNSAQVLTISSSSLFNNRVAIGSDLKVVGGVGVSGTTSLADLTVDKTSTLGVTAVRGSLSVAGPLSLQSPAVFSAGATDTGNLTVSGNGSFGGSLSAGTLNIRDLTVTGTLNLAGHISVAGATPTVSPGSESGAGATADIEGNDASGTVTINTGTIPSHIGNQGGLLVTINFGAAYPRAPHIIISSDGQNGASVLPYVLKAATNFTIGAVNDAHSGTSYSFDYWVTQ